MKTEALIQRGLVSDSMVKMLQTSLAQRHQNALDVSNQRLAIRQQEALSGEAPIPQMNRELFPVHLQCGAGQLSSKRRRRPGRHPGRGGFGKEATAQAHRENPPCDPLGHLEGNILGAFSTPPVKFLTGHGGTRTQKSEYQSYADSWQHFPLYHLRHSGALSGCVRGRGTGLHQLAD